MDDIGIFIPACIIKRLSGGANGGSCILDTAVYHIETENYIREAVMPLVEALKAVDEAIVSATAGYLSALGVGIVRHYAHGPEDDGSVVPVMEMRVETTRSYARRVLPYANDQMASTSIFRMWRHTPAGWLVTDEGDNASSGEYCYRFHVPE